MISREALIQEIRVAHSILEDYHHKCRYDKIDETIEIGGEAEYCRSDDTAYGTGFDQLTCYEHDRLRAWDKIVKDEVNVFFGRELKR